jgi:exodeoxyribonuclease V alpha subunit
LGFDMAQPELKAVRQAPDNEAVNRSVTEQVVRGEVLRLVFVSSDGEYAVVRLLDSQNAELTLVGALGDLLEGQDVEARGVWESHKEHGRQFRVNSVRAILPSTEAGIQRYLASGLIYGIGPKLAERIVSRFGVQTLEVLGNYSSRLKEVPGLGKKRIAEICDAWHQHSQKRDIYIFLQGLGFGAAHCARLFKLYGAAAAEVVRRNPYQLASEVQGIGFLTADKIADNLGVAPDSLLRLTAGVVYVLEGLATQGGHVCYPRPALLTQVAKILEVDEAQAVAGLENAILDGQVVADATASPSGEVFIYSRLYYNAETELTTHIQRLIGVPSNPVQVNFQGAGFERLNQEQRQAVQAVFQHPLSIITGGPGVGKTTVVGEIIAHARQCGMRGYLAAPTGRAAKRLSESTRSPAKTIHRLLKWDPVKGAFVHDASRPLRCDLLIVDEVSMLDVSLACHLFRAVSAGTRVVFVGDRDQLPSVGAGAVLHDLIACGRIAVTNLTEIYRQGRTSHIVSGAHAVNRGEMPMLPVGPQNTDFYWIDEEDPERVMETIARLVSVHIPRRFRLDPIRDIQVLTPMNRGNCGAAGLNELLQGTLNGAASKPQFKYGERVFRVGDRVMQVVNNYDKSVFNGDQGQITSIDYTQKSLKIRFDEGEVDYEWAEADQLKLAYAVTVHKSQGSEFPAVVMPVMTQHFIMLQRNLIYTGMTRARKLLVMVGTRKALSMAIRNNKPMSRFSLLADRLRAQ